MACSCSKNKTADGKPKSFTVTAKDGKKTAYQTEVEAAAAARRLEGSYKAG
jgi:hypothetical protein